MAIFFLPPNFLWFFTFISDLQSNASSGMGVDEHSKSTFLELQRKKVHRYVIFKIDEKKKEVVVEKTGAPGESYDDFTAALPENDCRYAIYDFDYVTEDNCQKSKIFFIAWLASFNLYISQFSNIHYFPSICTFFVDILNYLIDRVLILL